MASDSLCFTTGGSGVLKTHLCHCETRASVILKANLQKLVELSENISLRCSAVACVDGRICTNFPNDGCKMSQSHKRVKDPFKVQDGSPPPCDVLQCVLRFHKLRPFKAPALTTLQK